MIGFATAGRSQDSKFTFWPLAGALPSSGLVDGVGSSARFDGPINLAVDPSGNLYVIDGRLRKITPDGTVTPLIAAGSGCQAVAVDAAGNVYCSRGAQIIRINPKEEVTVLAGQEEHRYADGPAATAGFIFPCGLAIDRDGNIYVVEGREGVGLSTHDGEIVRRISPDGQVTTVAGSVGRPGFVDAPGALARFNDPSGIVVGTDGNLYITDRGNNAIRKVTPQGEVTTLISPRGLLAGPGGLTIGADGTLFVANTGSDTVVTVKLDGSSSIIAGGEGEPGAVDDTGRAARFKSPQGIAMDGRGVIWIADTFNHTIRRIDQQLRVTTAAGRANPAGSRDGWASAASFHYPAGVAFAPDGCLYVADSQNACIRKVTTAGVVSIFSGVAGQRGYADGLPSVARFEDPSSLTAAPDGNLYAIDGAMIRKISSTGAVTTLAGRPSNRRGPPFSDGKGSEASFGSPQGIAVGSNGAVFVADELTYTVRRIADDGQVTTFAGTPGVSGSNDGPGQEARFGFLGDIVPDVSGVLYVVDRQNRTIRKIALNGGVTTLPLRFSESWMQDDWFPVRLALNSRGEIFVGGGGLLWKISSDGEVNLFRQVEEVITHGGGMAFDRLDRLYLTDAIAQQIWVGVETSRPSHLMNVSCRSTASSGDKTLIAGFIIEGGECSILARGIGPTLGRYGVQGAIPRTSTRLFSGPSVLAENSGWSTALNAREIAAASAEVGAFALDPRTNDSVVMELLKAGAYTVHVAGVDNTNGVALAEIYGLTNPAPDGRLINLSGRAFVGTGENILIAGFIIAGNTPKRVLIRAAGPALAGFGVTGVLARPHLRLYSENNVIAEDMGWSGTFAASSLSTAFNEAGAFPFVWGSNDAALLVTLQPGAYTAQVSGLDDTVGVVLAEVYALP